MNVIILPSIAFDYLNLLSTPRIKAPDYRDVIKPKKLGF